jgi:hypothetical protein
MLGDKQIPGRQLYNTVIWAEMPFKCQGLVTHGWVWAKADDHSLPLNIIILCQHKLCFRVLGFSCRLNLNDMILVQCFIVVHSSSPKDENHLFFDIFWKEKCNYNALCTSWKWFCTNMLTVPLKIQMHLLHPWRTKAAPVSFSVRFDAGDCLRWD